MIDPYKRMAAAPVADENMLSMVEREARAASPEDVVRLSAAWKQRRAALGRISPLRPQEVLSSTPARRLETLVPSRTATAARNMCRAMRDVPPPSRLPFATWHSDIVFMIALVPLALTLAVALASLATPNNPWMSLSSQWFALVVYASVVTVVLGVVVTAMGARARGIWGKQIAGAVNSLVDAMTAYSDQSLGRADAATLAEPWALVFAARRVRAHQ